MAASSESCTDLAALETAYRRSLFTILSHVIFVVVCCVLALVLRRLFKLPPALLGVALIVALIMFGADIVRFIRCRDRLRAARSRPSRG